MKIIGFFNVNLSSSATTSVTTSTGSNPLLVVLNAVPNNIANVMSNNSMVLSIVFLAVVVGLCINALGEKILILKNLMKNVK